MDWLFLLSIVYQKASFVLSFVTHSTTHPLNVHSVQSIVKYEEYSRIQILKLAWYTLHTI